MSLQHLYDGTTAKQQLLIIYDFTWNNQKALKK